MVSEELKKMFEGRIEMQDMHYVGKACYGRLEENLRGKIELGQGFMDSGYTRLTVSVARTDQWAGGPDEVFNQ